MNRRKIEVDAPTDPTLPPMSFRIEDLLNPRAHKNGPMIVFWGQEEPIEYEKEKPLKYPKPELPLWRRVIGFKPFQITYRLVPPPGVKLTEFGVDLAERLNIPYDQTSKAEEDRAIWITGACLARHAPHALGGASQIFQRLQGVRISEAQVKVVRA